MAGSTLGPRQAPRQVDLPPRFLGLGPLLLVGLLGLLPAEAAAKKGGSGAQEGRLRLRLDVDGDLGVARGSSSLTAARGAISGSAGPFYLPSHYGGANEPSLGGLADVSPRMQRFDITLGFCKYIFETANLSFGGGWKGGDVYCWKDYVTVFDGCAKFSPDDPSYWQALLRELAAFTRNTLTRDGWPSVIPSPGTQEVGGIQEVGGRLLEVCRRRLQEVEDYDRDGVLRDFVHEFLRPQGPIMEKRRRDVMRWMPLSRAIESLLAGFGDLIAEAVKVPSGPAGARHVWPGACLAFRKLVAAVRIFGMQRSETVLKAAAAAAESLAQAIKEGVLALRPDPKDEESLNLYVSSTLLLKDLSREMLQALPGSMFLVRPAVFQAVEAVLTGYKRLADDALPAGRAEDAGHNILFYLLITMNWWTNALRDTLDVALPSVPRPSCSGARTVTKPDHFGARALLNEVKRLFKVWYVRKTAETKGDGKPDGQTENKPGQLDAGDEGLRRKVRSWPATRPSSSSPEASDENWDDWVHAAGPGDQEEGAAQRRPEEEDWEQIEVDCDDVGGSG